MPSGHIQDGELPNQTAIKEVDEEVHYSLFDDSKSDFNGSPNKNVHGSLKHSEIILGVDRSLLNIFKITFKL